MARCRWRCDACAFVCMYVMAGYLCCNWRVTCQYVIQSAVGSELRRPQVHGVAGHWTPHTTQHRAHLSPGTVAGSLAHTLCLWTVDWQTYNTAIVWWRAVTWVCILPLAFALRSFQLESSCYHTM